MWHHHDFHISVMFVPPLEYDNKERPKWTSNAFLGKLLNRSRKFWYQVKSIDVLRVIHGLDFAYSPRGAHPSPLKMQDVRIKNLSNRLRPSIKLCHLLVRYWTFMHATINHHGIDPLPWDQLLLTGSTPPHHHGVPLKNLCWAWAIGLIILYVWVAKMDK